MIPDAAVEAAAREFYGDAYGDVDGEELKYVLDQMRDTLEAAAPYMLARVTELADGLEAEGEQSMAAAKKIPDEHIAMTLLMDGATMVENARLIRNAIGAAK